MAQSRFSRRSEGGDNNMPMQGQAPRQASEMPMQEIPSAPEPAPERTAGRKGGGLGAFAAKAKEKLGSAAGNIKGVFSKEDKSGKKPRTAEADVPFEAPAAPPVSEEYVPQAPMPQASQNAAPQMPQEAHPQPAPHDDTEPAPHVNFRQRSEASRTVPERENAQRSGQEQGLPSRWDARNRGGELYFSDRMSDKGFKAKEPEEFEVKKRAAYQGQVVGLSSSSHDDDGTEHFYTPNIDVGDENRRTRYKKKNRRPLKLWQKGVITGVCITAAFVGFIFGMINLMLIGKMNHMDVSGSKDMNDLYFYSPKMVSSIIDDTLSIDQEDRTRLTKLNDAFELSDLAVKSDKNVQNFLCIALDEKDNADAIVIVSIDEKTKKVRFVNILPELYVPLADQIDGINYGSTLRQIYAYGGAAMLADTVEDTLKVAVDNYFVLDFTAFETVVNHLGGADITITEEKISYWMATNKYDPQNRFGGTGRFTLSGEEALIYSRMSELDNSFARANRQHEMLAKLCARLSEYGTLDHVSVLYNALSYVTTDCAPGKMLSLCGNMKKYGDYEVKAVTVPISGTYTEGYVSGKYLLASNITVNANDIQLFLYSNDMTYADGGVEVNVLLPELTEVLDVPEEPASSTDIPPSDAA